MAKKVNKGQLYSKSSKITQITYNINNFQRKKEKIISKNGKQGTIIQKIIENINKLHLTLIIFKEKNKKHRKNG